jgi:hypothetical protein
MQIHFPVRVDKNTLATGVFVVVEDNFLVNVVEHTVGYSRLLMERFVGVYPPSGASRQTTSCACSLLTMHNRTLLKESCYLKQYLGISPKRKHIRDKSFLRRQRA